MSSNQAGDSLVVQQFREFYRRIIELKRSVGIVPGAAVTPNAQAVTSLDVASIRTPIVQLLEAQQRTAAHVGGDYIIAYDDARYVMAALADEIFLHSAWYGRYAWNDELIENRFYGTRIAGDLFFQRAERLMASPHDSMNVELAKIYLMALSLGFEGRYRGVSSSRECDEYRRRLSAYVFGDHRSLAPDSPALFPRAHAFTLGSGERRLLPPLRRWAIRLAAVVLIALAIQHVVWRLALTSDVWTVLREVLALQST